MRPKHLQRKLNVWQSVCLLSLVALLLVVLGFPGLAGAQDDVTIENKDLQSAMAYWTPDRMAAAIPKDISLPGGPQKPAELQLPSGTPGLVGGGRPGQKPMQGPGLMPALELTSGAPVPFDGGYPGPHDTYEYYPRYRTYPISAIGRLFFHDPVGGGNYSCSAAVLYIVSPDTIWTAGHCVANGGHSQFYDNWVFCPSYDSSQGGPNPNVGCWSWASAAVRNDWYQYGCLTRDFAIIQLASSGGVSGNHVAAVTGGLGFAWNWSRDQHWFHFGYPGDPAPWTGGKIIATASEHRYDDAPDECGPNTNSWGSDQGHGSSGSAVIRKFSYGGGGYINSNVSYGYDGEPGELYGPYFDTVVCNFMKTYTGWGGGC